MVTKTNNEKISEKKKGTCRICYDLDNTGNMINPCKCTGTIKWVHEKCLEKWINVSKKETCNTCKYKYKINKLSNFPSLEFLNTEKYKKTISLIILSGLLLVCCHISYNYLGWNRIYKSNYGRCF